MAKTKTKFAKFDVVAAVKCNARDNIGTPKSSFVILPKTKRRPRHKKNFFHDSED